VLAPERNPLGLLDAARVGRGSQSTLAEREAPSRLLIRLGPGPKTSTPIIVFLIPWTITKPPISGPGCEAPSMTSDVPANATCLFAPVGGTAGMTF
jgi:hypothetical protein